MCIIRLFRIENVYVKGPFNFREKMSEKKEKFQMTKEEEKKLTDAMQKPEFRELLFDYVKEIQDPANREQYESELKKEKSSLF